MKWKSHTAIARAVATMLWLPEPVKEALVEGSIEPDKYPDTTLKVGRRGRAYVGVAPHHNPEYGLIMKYIRYARQYYLQGNDAQAARNLGRALHYIQDKCVYKGFLGGLHDQSEAALASQNVSWDAIKKGISEAKCSPAYVEKCVSGVRPMTSPQEIMSQASVTSASIAKAVFGRKDPPSEVVENYKCVKRRHWGVTVPAALIALGASLVAYLITHNFLYILPGAVAGWVIYNIDFSYYRWKKEAKWFGVK